MSANEEVESFFSEVFDSFLLPGNGSVQISGRTLSCMSHYEPRRKPMEKRQIRMSVQASREDHNVNSSVCVK